MGWRERRAHQLAPDRVGGLDGARVEEVLVAPIVTLRVLLVRVVHVEQRQVVTCRGEAPVRVVLWDLKM